MIAYLLPMLGVWLLLTVLYLWMVMPRMWNIPGKEPFMGVLYAHRGLFDHSAGIPENSLAAFRRAVDAGYGIELDVQRTAFRWCSMTGHWHGWQGERAQRKRGVLQRV